MNMNMNMNIPVKPMAQEGPLTKAPIKSTAKQVASLSNKQDKNTDKFADMLSKSIDKSSESLDQKKATEQNTTGTQDELAAMASAMPVVKLVSDNANLGDLQLTQQNVVPIVANASPLVAVENNLADDQKSPLVEVNVQPQIKTTTEIDKTGLSSILNNATSVADAKKSDAKINNMAQVLPEKLVLGLANDSVMEESPKQVVAPIGMNVEVIDTVKAETTIMPQKTGVVTGEQDKTVWVDVQPLPMQNQATQQVNLSQVIPETTTTLIKAVSSEDTGDAGNNLATDIFSDKDGTGTKSKPLTVETTPFAGVLDQQSQKVEAGANIIPDSKAVQQPGDRHNVLGQIVDQARVINRSNNSEMIIKLKPEHLGELTLKIVVENGAVSAKFLTNQPEVRSAIEASLPQLRQELSNQGLKVDQVGVYTSLNQSFGNDHQQSQQAQQQFQTAKHRSELRDNQEFVDTIEKVAAATPATADTGIDYRI
ncbi:MAG: Flagellar hook-length control protein-like protein [Firmicutes bacterium]|nr:Flagellar hook-length control protein-like protein [Bacillota bacterium]